MCTLNASKALVSIAAEPSCETALVSRVTDTLGIQKCGWRVSCKCVLKKIQAGLNYVRPKRCYETEDIEDVSVIPAHNNCILYQAP